MQGMTKPKKHANKVGRLTYDPKLNTPLPYNPTYVRYKAKYKELYLCRFVWR